MAARRVAFEMGERVGETTGYQVRFEEVSGPRTRLRFLTEGVLTRRLMSDAELRGVSAVVLDEFHERHLDGDVALALLRRLQLSRRGELKLIVMSATLEGERASRYLGGCPVVRSEGRLFPLDIRHSPHSSAPLEVQVRTAIETLNGEGWMGDTLVFLPGAAEIRATARECQALASRLGADLLPLHGDLSPEEQDRAVTRSTRPKIILSTNVAESSLTIDGVTAVIDSGLARVARDSPWTGLPSLDVVRVSKASATQRAGRAGRTGPGRVIRLYPLEDFVRRPEHETPEILRRELSGLCLELSAMRIRPDSVPWFEPPPPEALEAASRLLDLLNADSRGREMARLPLHPRLASLVLDAGQTGCAMAAALSGGERIGPGRSTAGPSDLLNLAESRDWAPHTRRLYDQLTRKSGRSRAPESAVLKAVLRAFPDRVAKRRGAGNELLLSGGGSAVLSDTSCVRTDLMVAVDIEERRERGLPLVRLASAIEPEWLLDFFPHLITEKSGVEWNRTAQRVESVSALLYGNLVIEESRSGSVDLEAAAGLLAAKAVEEGIERFVDSGEVEEALARIAFAGQHANIPEVRLENALAALCHGLRSFAELKQAAGDGGLVRAALAALPADARRKVEELAPERFKLPRGRTARVRYARGQPPWIASRLQDFFGMRETPRLAGGRVPAVVHLLAPNQRPVQVTSDLAGFWTKWYPDLRTSLSRRYPKHPWPENPG